MRPFGRAHRRKEKPGNPRCDAHPCACMLARARTRASPAGQAYKHARVQAQTSEHIQDIHHAMIAAQRRAWGGADPLDPGW